MWALCGLEAPRHLEQDLQGGEVWHAGQSQPTLWTVNIFILTQAPHSPTERAHCLKEISSN